MVGVDELRRCRVCDGQVFDDDAWYEIEPLGRFWVCSGHREGMIVMVSEFGAVLYGQEGKPGWFSLGPYPYENVPEPFVPSAESVLETAERMGLR